MTFHLNVNGFSGVGKTTILNRLASRHRTIWIPRVTTRPRRKHEKANTEYEFVTEEEFEYRLGQVREVGTDILFSTDHVVLVRKQEYRTGIPNPRHWPSSSPYIDLVLSTFGYASPSVKKYYEEYYQDPRVKKNLGEPNQDIKPNHLPMVNVFISMHDIEKMRERLYKRCRKEDIDFGSKWRKNEEHFNDPFDELYDYVVFNDGSIEDCVAQLEQIAGFTRPPDPR